MTHGHLNGKCLDKFEEIGCRSPYRTNTGKPATFEEYDGRELEHSWSTDPPEKITLDIRSTEDDAAWEGEARKDVHAAHIREIAGADTVKVYDGGEQYYEVDDIGDLYNTVGEPEVLEPEAGRDKLSRANNVEVLEQLNDALAQSAKMPAGVTGDRPLGQITEHHEYIVPPPPSFEQLLARRFEACESLLIRKHRDYGPKNISNSPGGALNGLRVRMHDKLARINNLYSQIYDETSYNDIVTENESFRDSFVDLVNYGVIALMVLDGVWPEA